MAHKVYIILLLGIVIGCTNDDKTLLLQQKIDLLEQQVDSLTKELAVSKTVTDNPWFDKNQAPKLLRYPIPDPEQFIDSSLRATPEVIPSEAVLGGRMTFKNIQVLGDKWVIADYEDGHVMGQSIFSYSWNDNEKLEFTPLLTTEK
ncbi:hypothetical protein G5B30_09810 [Sphingobacterium sp. SGG-5]|uniref:hypothetical protein n=1 Tax=Sphingobacterium sp. SGG-5 TaxID=2710881 RepID=UPI0013EB75D6|nr:hypothetical protein [Sphingobacterium sp. SGG-5]NGM62209.1 hypothetical protein [Sphingobacterium sp. SGG-5]